eukprot:11222842-Lingulodinium_polyedra.AAC.1
MTISARVQPSLAQCPHALAPLITALTACQLCHNNTCMHAAITALCRIGSVCDFDRVVNGME